MSRHVGRDHDRVVCTIPNRASFINNKTLIAKLFIAVVEYPNSMQSAKLTVAIRVCCLLTIVLMLTTVVPSRTVGSWTSQTFTAPYTGYYPSFSGTNLSFSCPGSFAGPTAAGTFVDSSTTPGSNGVANSNTTSDSITIVGATRTHPVGDPHCAYSNAWSGLWSPGFLLSKGAAGHLDWYYFNVTWQVVVNATVGSSCSGGLPYAGGSASLTLGMNVYDTVGSYGWTSDVLAPVYNLTIDCNTGSNSYSNSIQIKISGQVKLCSGYTAAVKTYVSSSANTQVEVSTTFSSATAYATNNLSTCSVSGNSCGALLSSIVVQ